MPAVTIMIKPVSGLCNMGCSYCFYEDELQHRAGDPLEIMSTGLLEKAVRRVLRSADHAVHFLFQGGEPTLAGVSFFSELVRFQREYNAKSLNITNAVQTNGLHLPDEMIRFFADNHFLVGVSLDGTRKTHDRYRKDRQGNGTWERIGSNIRKLEQAGVSYNILTVVTKEITEHADEVLDELIPYRWLQFIPCMEPLDGTKAGHAPTPEAYGMFLQNVFERYEAAWQNHYPFSERTFDNWMRILTGGEPEHCGMTGHCGTSLMMESDGSLYPCDFYATEEWYLGNIATSPLLKILNSEKERRFIAESESVPARCGSCAYYRLCRNGCKRERGKKDRLNRWCQAYRSFFVQSYPRMCTMAEKLKQTANGN